MSLLIDVRDPGWMRDEDLRDVLAPLLPGIKIYCGMPDQPLPDVVVLAVAKLYPGQLKVTPNLKMVQKLGAGVDGILKDPDLPANVRVARLKPDAPADEIAEYCLAYVLAEQRNLRVHEKNAKSREWQQIAPTKTSETTVGVLGLGHIGARTAKRFAANGFRVIGWSRSPKSISGVDCRYGEAGLKALLAECDYIASILPSTPATRDLFNAEVFAAVKLGAVLINAGRGDLINERDLLNALNSGQLAHTVLDVFRTEPLPADHPFWLHEKITITPHVSGWHLDGGLEDIAENYRRLINGKPLLHEVDKTAGY